MANSFPIPAVASIQYYVDLGALSEGIASVAAGRIQIIAFTFTPAGSYGTFDQGAVEAGIASMLNGMCAAWGAVTGLTTAAVQAAVTVTRVWTFANPVLGTAGPQFTLTDQMTYP